MSSLYNVQSSEFRDVAIGNFALRDISGAPDQHIVWSPDGKYLAFSVITLLAKLISKRAFLCILLNKKR